MRVRATWTALLVFVSAGCGATARDTSNSGSSGGPNSTVITTASSTTESSSVGGSGGTTEGAGGTSGGSSEAGPTSTGGAAGTGTTSPWNTCELPLPPAPSDEPSAWVLELDGLATRWAEASCAYYLRCNYERPDRAFGDLPSGCVAYYERDIANRRIPLLVAGLESGRAFYDEEAMGACLETAANGPCGEVDLSCEDAAGGLVPPGGSCGSSFECEGEATCNVTNECPGVCVPLDDRVPTQAEGMPCDDAACLPGLVCLNERLAQEPLPDLPSERNTCVVPAQANEPCPSTLGPSPYPCADEGYRCAWDGGSLRCLLPLGEGEACDDRSPPCQEGLRCVYPDNGSGVCSQFVYAELDEPCGSDIECAPGTTCVSLPSTSNVANTRCVAEASPGGTCYAIGDNCPPEEYCVAPDPPEGEAPYTGTCEPRKQVGDACETGEECQPLTNCLCGVCEARAQIGEACRHDVSCWSLACVDGVCAPPNECP